MGKVVATYSVLSGVHVTSLTASKQTPTAFLRHNQFFDVITKTSDCDVKNLVGMQNVRELLEPTELDKRKR